MIKKNTKAIFINGDFKGEYDWQGGIPLSEKEIMTVKINGKLLRYTLNNKQVSCDVKNENQIINVVYTFELK